MEYLKFNTNYYTALFVLSIMMLVISTSDRVACPADRLFGLIICLGLSF
jgi:hypothetical protein